MVKVNSGILLPIWHLKHKVGKRFKLTATLLQITSGNDPWHRKQTARISQSFLNLPNQKGLRILHLLRDQVLKSSSQGHGVVLYRHQNSVLNLLQHPPLLLFKGSLQHPGVLHLIIPHLILHIGLLILHLENGVFHSRFISPKPGIVTLLQHDNWVLYIVEVQFVLFHWGNESGKQVCDAPGNVIPVFVFQGKVQRFDQD